MKFERLFTPITIKGMVLKNRIVMPAIHHMYTPHGYATSRFNEYYWRRAEGGAGLIFVGGCRFDDYGASRSMISLQTDDFIPGFKEFTDGMHKRGSKVGVQLYQAGAYSKSEGLPEGERALAPSAIFSKFTKETPKEMTKEEIQNVIENWAAGALRAKKAGFDTVELIASAGYLINQFLSPLKNKRTDEYGGIWDNRTRFAKELIVAVREAVGPDYPISMRITGNDFIDSSNTNVEAVEFCKLMEEHGVDMLNVTGGWHETTVPQVSGDLPRGGFSYLAAAIKDSVSIPVMVSNRINDPVVAEKLLAVDVADMVSVGRAFIADPDWVVKANEGRANEIRHCVACNQGCLAKAFFMKPIECLVNGDAGLEYIRKEITPSSSKKVLVVGGGPAGCEFAIKAAEHGHEVTLWEKEDEIGGQLSMVATPPGKQEFLSLIEYYKEMLKKHNVAVERGKKANATEIAIKNYDAVVVATGITPNVINLPGGSNIPVISAYDILEKKRIPGKNVVVIGGGAVGCETAQFLAHEASASPELVYFLLEHKAEKTDKVLELMNNSRRKVTIVDIQKIGAGFEPGTGWTVRKDLARLGVTKYPFSKLLNIGESSIEIEVTDRKSGKTSVEHIPCDSIILSVGAKSNNGLYNELVEKKVNVYNLGDSRKVGKVIDAIRDANELAVNI